MHQKLLKTLHLDSLTLVHQPQCRVEDGRIIGTEALLRGSKNAAPINPELLVAKAEANLMGNTLALWTALQAKKDAELLFPKGNGRVRLNLMEQQIADPHFRKDLRDILGGPGQHKIDIEIVEQHRLGLKEMPRLDAGVRDLRSMGAQILLDDWMGNQEDHRRLEHFGQHTPLTVKLDKEWIRQSHFDQGARLQEEAAMLRSHGVQLLAEGPDSSAGQKRLLHRMGVRVAQGYDWHRPQPTEVVLDLLKSQNAAPIVLEKATPLAR